MTEHTSRRRFLKAAAATGALAGLNATVLAQDGGGNQSEEVIVLGGYTQGWRGYRLPGGDADGSNENPTLSLEADTTYTLVWENGDGQPHNFALQDDQGENLQVLEPLGIEADAYQQLNETDASENVSLEVSDGNVTGVSAGNETGGMGGGNETGDGGGNQSGDGGEQVAQSETVSEQGAVQAVRFTASEDMAQYICPIHPNTMVGDVELGSGGGGDGGNGSGGGSN